MSLVRREGLPLHLRVVGLTALICCASPSLAFPPYETTDAETERGWRASVLAEFPRGKLRPGVELFVRDSDISESQMQAGVGLIASLERMEIRTGLHVGLNDAAPDLEGTCGSRGSGSTQIGSVRESRVSIRNAT